MKISRTQLKETVRAILNEMPMPSGGTPLEGYLQDRLGPEISGILMDAVARAKFTRDEQYSATLPRSKDSADRLRKNRDPNYFDITNPNNFLETRVRRKSGKINQTKQIVLK